MNRKFIISILLLLVISSITAAETVDKIVAKVGDEIVLKSELEEQFQYMQSAGIENDNVTKLNVLNSIIENKLILQKAEKEGYETTDYKIEATVDQQINNMKARYQSEAQFEAAIQQNGMTLFQLKRFYKKKIKEQKLKERIIQAEIINKINITAPELEEYYQENINQMPMRQAMDKIGIIKRNVDISDESKEKILNEMNNIIDKINNGESFSKLAKEYSEGPSAKHGGDLGFFTKGMMVKPFEEAAFKLQEGEISNVVKTQFGYHIIKMEEIKGDEIRVRHILKQVEPTEKDFRRELDIMKSVLDTLRSGEDFTKIASQYSEDDKTLKSAGILGEFTPDAYPEKYKDQLELLDYGEYSNVIRNDDELIILKKIKKIPERKFNFTEIEHKLRMKVEDQKKQELYQNFVKELKKNSYVEILLEEN